MNVFILSLHAADIGSEPQSWVIDGADQFSELRSPAQLNGRCGIFAQPPYELVFNALMLFRIWSCALTPKRSERIDLEGQQDPY